MSTRPFLAQTPVALAHRGGALYGPNVGLENTMTAFGNAVAMGYTHLETDVHVTRDGLLVAFHDIRLDRVSDRTGLIRELEWAQVREATLGDSEHVPLLTDVLDAWPGINLNVDLKAAGTGAPLWALIEERGLHDRMCVGSFSQRRISEFRRLARGRVATSAAPPGVALARYAPRAVTGAVTRLLRHPADVFQVPASIPLRGRQVTVVTPRFVEAAHGHGKQVHVWTIDDAAEMNRLLDLGVDGLVSDRIDVLKQVLLDRGAWTGNP
jgi:glycerophosphoryl diester phosphodiesterase